MTWKEIKLVALQTMFSNDGTDLTEDDNNRAFLQAMPGKANEAMMQIVEIGKPIVKTWQIEIDPDADEEDATDEDKLVLPLIEGGYLLQLKTYLTRFRCMDETPLGFTDESGYADASGWRMVGKDQLLIPGNTEGTFTVYYQAKPEKITSSTEDTYAVDMDDDAAALIPLYIAAELYKDDDLAMATTLRNEFEDGLNKLAAGENKVMAGTMVLKDRDNTTGWW